MSHKWDVRFLEMAKLVSSWSKDPSTQAGAVIVRPDRSVASVGFNGFARLMSDAPELYADRPKKYSRIIHCEVNAMIHAKESLAGCTLYTYPFACCDRCVVQMIQAGICRFVFPVPTADALTRWSAAFVLTKEYINEARLLYKEVDLENHSTEL